MQQPAENRRVHVLLTFALEPELVQQIEAVDSRLEVRVLGQEARQLFRGQRKYPSELEAQTARRELEEAMSADHVCYFLTQAAEAIDFLNARQHTVNGQRMAIRHCDVKPSNLLLHGKDVKLADFSRRCRTVAYLP